MPSPQAWRSSRQGRRGGQPAGDADRRIQRAGHHDRDVDLRGDRRAVAEIPPSGATFSTAMSAAPARTTASGSSALRMLSSAAIGTSTRRRSSASSVDRGAGLFEVLQRAVGGQRSGGLDGLVDAPAAVGVHPHGRHQFAHGVDPRDVVGQRLARLGDLHLGGARRPGTGPAPRPPARRRRPGTVALIGMRSRRGGGGRSVGGLDARRQPVRGLGRRRIRRMPRTRPSRPGRRSARASRVVMPRKRTRIGSATTCRRSSRSSRVGVTAR